MMMGTSGPPGRAESDGTPSQLSGAQVVVEHRDIDLVDQLLRFADGAWRYPSGSRAYAG